MGTRKRRREFRKREQEVYWALVGSFTEWLSTDTLPRPGYNVPDVEDMWRYLDGETEASQEQRIQNLTDTDRMVLGLYVEGIGRNEDGNPEATAPLIVVVP